MTKEELKEAIKEVLEENFTDLSNKYYSENNYAFDKKVEKIIIGLRGSGKPELPGGG